MQPIADFRSDTVTRPTPAMREAMAAAMVGDDGFGDDPTVIALQELGASMVGKEAALFCPSGTMANQIAVCVHTNSGDEILVEERGHVAWFEGGGAAFNARAQIRTFALEGGRLSPERADERMRLDIPDCPTMRLLCVENTLNMYGGAVWPLDNLRELRTWATGRGLSVHLDGARLFNAAVASGVDAREIAATADSVMFCLSKGLGAPVGSLLAGSRDLIARARRVRKRLGGQMRQVGILAAAGLMALRDGVDRLARDHALARWVVDAVAERAPEITLAQDRVETNIVLVRPPEGRTPAELVAFLKERGVLVTAFPGGLIRVVTHLDVDQEAAERLVDGMEAFCASGREA